MFHWITEWFADRMIPYDRRFTARERYEYEKLAEYNAEVSRGIAHTPEWKQKMKELQAIFDSDQRFNPCFDCRKKPGEVTLIQGDDLK
jgi:predicted adenine nucleotide alpha hydrolase (AANH) superfamily ATPase